MRNQENLLSINSERLLLKSHSGNKIIDMREILFCKAEGSYSRIFIEGHASSILVSKTLCKMEVLLKSNDFLRCHYSFIVNTRKILAFCSKNKTIIFSEVVIPVSRRKSQLVFLFLLHIGIQDEIGNLNAI